MEADTNLTTNFKFGEFYCNGVRPPEQYWENIKELATELQVLRDKLKRAIVITSGWRSVQHNKNVGGASRSQHLYGKAADIKVSGMHSKMVPLYVCRYTKLNGIGVSYSMNSITHVDTRSIFTMWFYS